MKAVACLLLLLLHRASCIALTARRDNGTYRLASSNVFSADKSTDKDACEAEPVKTNPDIHPGMDVVIRLPFDPPVAYLTIVNGCPYDFELIETKSRYMKDFDKKWSTIPAGESVQFVVAFGDADMDGEGEAHFQLKGTNRQFAVFADFYSDYQKQRDKISRVRIAYTELETGDVSRGELVDLVPADAGSVMGKSLQWVLTGSESYGYWSSANPPITWMHSTLDVLGGRKLKHVCMPGSHDAGMSTIDGNTKLSSWKNTQTQWLDIYHQLLRGSRWLDLRPCIGNDGKLMLCHYSVGVVALGGNGLTLEHAIEQINMFMDAFPGELVILDVSDESGFQTDVHIKETYPRLSDQEWIPILAKFRKGIRKPCNNLPESVSGDSDEAKKARLDNLYVDDFIGDGQGCVLTVVRNIPGRERHPKDGVYLYEQLPRKNDYSDTDNYVRMRINQVNKMVINRRLGKEGAEDTRDSFFVLSWTLTMKKDLITPLSNRAANAINSLFWYAYHRFTPYSFPNVLYVDYLGQSTLLDNGKSQDYYMAATMGHMTALAMAVNLQIASQNCYIEGGRI